MKKYTCTICGYVYDEAIGDSSRGILPGTAWEDVPENWVCPLCGAVKADFAPETIINNPATQELNISAQEIDSRGELSFGEISALCSNLSKGCMKQYRMEEAELFKQLADFYNTKGSIKGQLKDLITLVEQDLSSSYIQANLIAADASDRGALRSLIWGEKVTRILTSILNRYEKQQDALFENTHVYVCEICGFVYIGEELPEICPVCKVPNNKITEVKRG